MSSPSAKANRPLSPHLSIYHFTITMAMSVAHRITGAALYFGTLLVAWFLIAAASGPEAFAVVSAVYGSWFGLLVLFGYSWALFHHMLGGVRYLVWDTGAMMDKGERDAIAWATLAGSLALTVIVWVAIFILR
jgi:succinate dehydrogenase / fumarate reductase, cytochrome b subunit